MIGIVVVSHSRPLAEAAVALALQMVHGPAPQVVIAAGLDQDTLGTNALEVKRAIESIDSREGVLVLMDLGSAVLSTELALDLVDPGLREKVVLTPAPLVEGLVAAVVHAAGGASATEVAHEAALGLLGKEAHLGIAVESALDSSLPQPEATVYFTINLRHGLHARPAARLVGEVKRFDAHLLLTNLTTGKGPVPAASLSRVAALGAARGHELELTGAGRQAKEAVEAVLALAGRNFDEIDQPAPPPALERSGRGPLPASPGIAVGPVVQAGRGAMVIPAESASDPTLEWRRLREALAATRTDISRARARVAREAGESEAAILDAHLALLDDDDIIGASRRAIDEGTGAARAWADVLGGAAAALANLDDSYLNARAADIQGVGDQVLRHLLGLSGPTVDRRGILVAADLTPSDTADLDRSLVMGIVTAYGSPTSHSVILARSLSIPAVVGAGRAVLDLAEGTTLVLDGKTGDLLIDPPSDVVESYLRSAEAIDRDRGEALARSRHPARTSDGTVIEVAANIGSLADAYRALEAGADGVGLLRTEFLFLHRPDPPDSEEQEAVYRDIAQALGGRRLTIRTVDVGGDKPLRYLPVAAEANPFLGLRGIRLGLAQPEIMIDQLRAILGVARTHPVSVMFPMVSVVDELLEARRLLEAVADEQGGIPPGFKVGMMVEVPAAALNARAFAPLVDFFSIGTNDLTQYTLAAERGNESVAALADPLDPAVLALIDRVCRVAVSTEVRVAVCGEVASDPVAIPLLLGLGVNELSVAVPAIPAVKDTVRALSMAESNKRAALALTLSSAAAVRALP
jgi:phosphocarrier protein FPr